MSIFYYLDLSHLTKKLIAVKCGAKLFHFGMTKEPFFANLLLMVRCGNVMISMYEDITSHWIKMGFNLLFGPESARDFCPKFQLTFN